MDRLPDDPSPDEPTPDQPTADEPPAPVDAGDDGVPGIPPPPPYTPPPGESPPPPGEPPQPPGESPPPDAFASPAAPVAESRPGVGPGVATGCGLQVLAVIAFFATGGFIAGILGILWPFIVVTVAAALLMLSRRWRRFATGVLIVSAATWIVVIGPCIALLNPGMWGA